MRSRDRDLAERLWLQGLLRPEEQAKLSPARVWTDRLIHRLMDEVAPIRTRLTKPSMIVGYIQANPNMPARTLERQRQTITEWCQAQDLKLVSLHEDIVISNMAPLDQRPGLQAAVAALTSQSALMAVEWDRLSTHLLTAVGLQQMVMQMGAQILTVNEERQRIAELPPQVVILRLPGALIARLDRYVEH